MIRIILVILIALMLYDMYNTYYRIQEHFTADEAVANIASVYNNQNLTTTNLGVTGTATLNNVAATKLTTANLGSDSLFIGNAQNQSCPDLAAGAAVPGTQGSLYGARDKCSQICPAGSYMVGIYNGSYGSNKNPICKWFNK
jgi:hypothetical protein